MQRNYSRIMVALIGSILLMFLYTATALADSLIWSFAEVGSKEVATHTNVAYTSDQSSTSMQTVTATYDQSEARTQTNYGFHSAFALAKEGDSEYLTYAASESQWLDDWTIQGTPLQQGAPSQGFLQYTLSGSFINVQECFLSFQVDIYQISPFAGPSQYPIKNVDEKDMGCTSGDCSFSETIRGNFDFTYGGTYRIESELYVSVRAGSVGIDFSRADFEHTATLDFIELPEGGEIISSSGFSYNTSNPNAPIPEPASLLLLGTGLGALGLAAFRRKRK